MRFYGSVLRPALFHLDAETAHGMAMRFLRLPGAARLLAGPRCEDPILRRTEFGREFANPVGLAAGFDKDGVAMAAWGALGFGFVEVGTVTPKPQPGNPRPRLFRLPADRALINRMGFNSAGASALGARLAAAPAGIPIGVNIGKGRDTPLAEAAKDYAEAARVVLASEPPLQPSPFEKGEGAEGKPPPQPSPFEKGGGSRVAYLAINVSSPNTPGLRELQDVGALAEIVAAVKDVAGGVPLLVKVAPDMALEDLDAIVGLAAEKGLAGIIATNTTLSREGLSADPVQEGGLSGVPLHRRAVEFIRRIRERAPQEMVVVGVGGVFTPEDVIEMLDAGASLVQLYTSFIYEGPAFPARLVRGLARLMRGQESGAPARSGTQGTEKE